jgi:hypothetical protein
MRPPLPRRYPIGKKLVTRYKVTNFSQSAYHFVNEGQRGSNEADEVGDGNSHGPLERQLVLDGPGSRFQPLGTRRGR